MRMLLKNIFYGALIMLGLAACSKEDAGNSLGEAIRFRPSLEGVETKVTLFENTLTDKSIGGGDFRLSAYASGSDEAAIYNARVNYNDGNWGFRNEMGTPENDNDDMPAQYWWPVGTNLNFFAYMPLKSHRLAKTGFTVEGYTHETGPRFSCNLPLDKAGQSDLQEFIYAYAEDQNLATQEANGGVPLQFRHPLSCIIFKLGDSYRITINSVRIDGIDNTGTFTGGVWTNNTAQDHTLFIEVNETVSEGLNTGSVIGGPYLVLPQDFSSDLSRLVLNYDYPSLGEDDKDTGIAIKQLNTKWEPGKKYTYLLSKGDSGEEVVFDVLVDEWDVVSYRNEIDVE